jgi:hypothetical protein
VFIHLPDRIDHRMIMCVEDVFLKLGVAGDVDLGNALSWDAVEILVGIKIMVA